VRQQIVRQFKTRPRSFLAGVQAPRYHEPSGLSAVEYSVKPPAAVAVATPNNPGDTMQSSGRHLYGLAVLAMVTFYGAQAVHAQSAPSVRAKPPAFGNQPGTFFSDVFGQGLTGQRPSDLASHLLPKPAPAEVQATVAIAALWLAGRAS